MYILKIGLIDFSRSRDIEILNKLKLQLDSIYKGQGFTFSIVKRGV